MCSGLDRFRVRSDRRLTARTDALRLAASAIALPVAALPRGATPPIRADARTGGEWVRSRATPRAAAGVTSPKWSRRVSGARHPRAVRAAAPCGELRQRPRTALRDHGKQGAVAIRQDAREAFHGREPERRVTRRRHEFPPRDRHRPRLELGMARDADAQPPGRHGRMPFSRRTAPALMIAGVIRVRHCRSDRMPPPPRHALPQVQLHALGHGASR
jgi:hypothetical protein